MSIRRGKGNKFAVLILTEYTHHIFGEPEVVVDIYKREERKQLPVKHTDSSVISRTNGLCTSINK